MQKIPASHTWKKNFFFINDLEETFFAREELIHRLYLSNDVYQFVNRGRREGAIRRFRWDGQCFYQGVEKRGDGWSRGASTGEINFRVTFLAKKKTGDACNRSRYIRANPGRRRGEATRNRRNEDKWITFRSLLCKNIPRFADYLYLDLWIKSPFDFSSTRMNSTIYLRCNSQIRSTLFA